MLQLPTLPYFPNVLNHTHLFLRYSLVFALNHEKQGGLSEQRKRRSGHTLVDESASQASLLMELLPLCVLTGDPASPSGLNRWGLDADLSHEELKVRVYRVDVSLHWKINDSLRDSGRDHIRESITAPL